MASLIDVSTRSFSPAALTYNLLTGFSFDTYVVIGAGPLLDGRVSRFNRSFDESRAITKNVQHHFSISLKLLEQYTVSRRYGFELRRVVAMTQLCEVQENHILQYYHYWSRAARRTSLSHQYHRQNSTDNRLPVQAHHPESAVELSMTGRANRTQPRSTEVAKIAQTGRAEPPIRR